MYVTSAHFSAFHLLAEKTGDRLRKREFYVRARPAAVLEAGADTTAMFTEIAIPAKLTSKDVTTRIGQNGEFGINVVAQAIQANGFDTWEAAFAAFDAQK